MAKCHIGGNHMSRLICLVCLQYAGGVFCKLEAQWKAAYMQQQAKQQAQAQLRYKDIVYQYVKLDRNTDIMNRTDMHCHRIKN